MLTENEINTDGSEQMIVEFTKFGTLEGYINLSNMQAGDTITIRYYIKVKKNGDYSCYNSETYTDAQTNPTVYFSKLPTKYGCKITLQQTVGSRTFDYIFFKQVTYKYSIYKE